MSSVYLNSPPSLSTKTCNAYLVSALQRQLGANFQNQHLDSCLCWLNTF